MRLFTVSGIIKAGVFLPVSKIQRKWNNWQIQFTKTDSDSGFGVAIQIFSFGSRPKLPQKISHNHKLQRCGWAIEPEITDFNRLTVQPLKSFFFSTAVDWCVTFTVVSHNVEKRCSLMASLLCYSATCGTDGPESIVSWTNCDDAIS